AAAGAQGRGAGHVPLRRLEPLSPVPEGAAAGLGGCRDPGPVGQECGRPRGVGRRLCV
ncbi:hypothetical protein E4U41_005338, partial [Claviceps citrina]